MENLPKIKAKLERIDPDYNPKDIQRYSGRTFVFRTNPGYMLHGKRLIVVAKRRPDLNGNEVSMITGIKPKLCKKVMKHLDASKYKSNWSLEKIMVEEGEQPEADKGLWLLISFKKPKTRYGLLIPEEIKGIC